MQVATELALTGTPLSVMTARLPLPIGPNPSMSTLSEPYQVSGGRVLTRVDGHLRTPRIAI